MGNKLWLDDVRPAPQGYDTIARTAPEAIQLLKSGHYSCISLDHDLGDPNDPTIGTGYDVAVWIEEQAYYGTLPRLIWNVHSANPVGVRRMIQALENADRYWMASQSKTKTSANQNYSNSAPNFLYHVTHARNLRFIATEGLDPGVSKNWPSYQHHAKGKLFCCDYAAVACWIHKLYYVGFDQSDDMVQEGWFPVVLRFGPDLVDVQPDQLGNRDCPTGQNYYTVDSVDPGDLEVWDRSGWVSLHEGIDEHLIQTALDSADQERDGDVVYYNLEEDVFRPRVAKHVRYRGAVYSKIAAVKKTLAYWDPDTFVLWELSGIIQMRAGPGYKVKTLDPTTDSATFVQCVDTIRRAGSLPLPQLLYGDIVDTKQLNKV